MSDRSRWDPMTAEERAKYDAGSLAAVAMPMTAGGYWGLVVSDSWSGVCCSDDHPTERGAMNCATWRVTHMEAPQ